MTREEKIAALRKLVIEQADAMGPEGWMQISVPDAVSPDGVLRVPKAPFEHWAVDLSGGSHLVSAWKTVSPVGVKQGADDPNHTDWMLGAGLDPNAMQSNGGNPNWEELSAAAYSARAQVERRVLDFRCSVLLQGPVVMGRVHIPERQDDYPSRIDGMPPVTVLRNAGSRWFDMALKTFEEGGAVIVENGGETTHLVTEFRPMGSGPIIRIEGARKLYPSGTLLNVDPGHGRVTMPEDETLVSERAATAMRAEPFVDDAPTPAPQAPARPLAKLASPDFGLEEIKYEVSKHRSYHTTYVEFGYKMEGTDYSIYSTWHYDKTGRYDIHHGYEMYLHVMVSPRDPADRAGRRLFISDMRIWKDGECRQACEYVRDIVDPNRQAEIDAWIRLREEEKARERSKLESLSDERLVALMRVHGKDEDGLWDDCESGIITNSERVGMLSDYAKLFAVFAEIAEARGLELDMSEIRPHKAHHAARMQEVADYERRRQEAFESVMALPGNTPPKGPR